MDFSSHNPTTSNALNLAARRNEYNTVERLLKKINPNVVDNRGWTSLHEAAANDSYESLILILKHRDCRPLAETHEGHTALYLACRQNGSLKTINALLNSVNDIANYGSTECVTPLHVASSQGNLEVMQLLIDHGAIIDVQDFDGDTPLHDAALAKQHDAVSLLLHAGANADIKNEPDYTPLHLACYKGCYKTVAAFLPFVSDINQQTLNGNTPLILAVRGYDDDVIRLLLDNGADPHIKNEYLETALTLALNFGYCSIFKILLYATDREKVNRDMVFYACKPHYFKFETLETVLNYDLGPEFFDYVEPFHITMEKIGEFQPVYLTNAPINSYLNICEYIYNQCVEKFEAFFYLFLMRGVAVDALDINECPPLVYIHYCAHNSCFPGVFKILTEFDCNVDHCSAIECNRDWCIPDAFLASLTSNPITAPIMLQYSLYCEPGYLIRFAYENDVLGRMPLAVQEQLISMVDSNYVYEGVTPEALHCVMPSLKHLSRLKIRSVIRNTGRRKTTKEFLLTLDKLNLPRLLKTYLRYL